MDFTGQYLSFNSHHPYTVKKEIVRCLQHRSKTISSVADAYQEEMISLRHNLHLNNYPERITLAPRNLYRRMEDNTRKLSTVYLPYVKGLAERIQKICSPYDIRTVFTSRSTLQSYITFVIHTPLMMAQSWAESTWEINNYGSFINQFPPNIIRSTR